MGLLLTFAWSANGFVVPDSVKAGNGQEKVTICHVAGNGQRIEITIGAPGAANHLKNHDDSPGKCENNCSAGYECDDGDLCTVDVCLNDNTCDFSQPVDCDDGNVCTSHGCEPDRGCVRINLDGLMCDDEDACTVVDTCSGGTCTGLEVTNCCLTHTDCNHDDPCEPEICANGRCVVDQDNAVQCIPSSLCVVASECLEGECVELSKSCSDADLCTIDEACDPFTGRCISEPKPCDEGYVCEAGECIPVFSCSEEGILDAIVAGSAAAFDCDVPTLVPVAEEIVVVNDVVLHGADNLILEGDGTHRMLAVPQGVTVELHGVTIAGGGGAQNGGAVYNEGTLIMRGGAVTGNHATKGGGVYNVGALSIYSTDESFMDNTAFEGGGIYNEGYAVITNATVARNTAEHEGGGIYNDGSLVLTNSTVSENQAVSRGGGIFSVGPELEVASNTMVDNAAPLGSAIWLRTLSLPALFRNNLIVGDCYIEGGVFSMGNNLQGPGDNCDFNDSGDFAGVPLDLLNVGPLQDNGGPRRADGSAPLTHALEAGSWAIDWIPPADCVDTQGLPLSTDARGVRRPQGFACDVGAVEGSTVFPCDEHGLRAAIATGGGPLTFDCIGPTTVQAGAPIIIDNDVILDGGGNLILDGSDSHRVLYVPAGVTAELVGFTVSGGGGGYGSGIYNDGTLSIVDSTISHNVGGGIINYGTLAVANSVLVQNTDAISGGAIANWALLTVTDSIVADNTSHWDGGIGNTDPAARATLSRTTITRNTALSQTTGGIGIGPGGEMTLTDCTVSGNHAPDTGGVGFGEGTTVTLVNTTVSGNTADALIGGIGGDGSLVVSNSTVSGNSAGEAAGGIGIGPNAVASLIHTTVVGNTAPVARAIGAQGTAALTLTNTLIEGDCFSYDALYSKDSGGHNIESPGDTCGLDDPTDLVNRTIGQLNLGPLYDNGGPTQTHAPLFRSVTINAIPIEACTLGTDQRGVARPQPEGESCDVGALEATFVGDWLTGTPESQGIDSEDLAILVERASGGTMSGSLLVIRNGVIVLDAYYYPYEGDRPLFLASVKKSVQSVLVGIAIDQGLLQINQKIWPLFAQDYPDIPIDGGKEDITLRHLLTMTSGLDCVDDGVAVANMLASEDWVRHVLELDMLYEPGTRGSYCTPAADLLSAVIAKVSGQSAFEFAQQYLFTPLGIDNAKWPIWQPGSHDLSHEVYLDPYGLAKIGELLLNQGEWNGMRVLPSDWVEQSTQGLGGYAYLWWIPNDLSGAYEARGWAGQRLLVWPEKQLIVVSYAGGDPHAVANAIQPDAVLPRNEEAHDRLTAAIANAAKPPSQCEQAVPTIATDISGRIYQLDANFNGIRCISLEFDPAQPSEASATFTSIEGEYTLPIGMDCVPRFSEEEVRGSQVGATGTWWPYNRPDAMLYQLRYDDVSGPTHLWVDSEFGGDATTVAITFSGGYLPSDTVEGHWVDADTCPAE